MSTRDSKVETSIIEMPNPEIAGFTAATDVLHASAAETAIFTSTDRDYGKYSKGLLVIDFTAFGTPGATPTIQFQLQGKDPLSGKYYVHFESASLTAATMVVVNLGDSTVTAPSQTNAPQTTTFSNSHGLMSTTYRLVTRGRGTQTSETFSAYIILKP